MGGGEGERWGDVVERGRCGAKGEGGGKRGRGGEEERGRKREGGRTKVEGGGGIEVRLRGEEENSSVINTHFQKSTIDQMLYIQV